MKYLSWPNFCYHPPQTGVQIFCVPTLLVILRNERLARPFLYLLVDFQLRHSKYKLSHFLTSPFDEMTSYLLIFCSIMLDRILFESSANNPLKVTDCVTLQSDSSFPLVSKIIKIIFRHSNLQIPCTIALNSCLALDLATTFYFLLLQASKFSPIKVQYPEVDPLLQLTLPSLHHFIFLTAILQFP